MTSKQVRLARLSQSDLCDIMQWINDPSVMGYFAGHQSAISMDDELKYIEKMQESPNDFVWSVFDKDSGDYVGQCSINMIHWPAKNGRIFMAITSEQQHKGYAPAILEALIERGFAQLGLHKLWLIVREENKASQAKYAKAGFKTEGVLLDEYYVQGRYHNMVRMSILSDY
jgi:diamine N-acetyltransferase